MPVPRRPRGAADGFDFAAQRGLRDSNDGQLGGLTFGDMAAIELADARGRFPMAHVRHLSDGFARPRYVTYLIGWQIHSPAKVPLVVRLYGYVARGIGFDRHCGDIAARRFGFNRGLAARGLVDGNAATGGLQDVPHILFDFAQLFLGGGERQLILPRHDGGYQLIPTHLHLGNLQLGLGFDQFETHLLFLRLRLGRGLHDFLFGLGQVGFGFAQLEFLLSGVEADDNIVLLDQLAVLAKEGDGHRLAAGHRNLEHLGIAALKFAFRRNSERDITSFHCYGWHFNRGGRGDGPGQPPGAERGDAE